MADAFTYTAYGLAWRVPFPCPTLPAAGRGVEPDVVVSEGSVPRCLDAPVAQDGFWDAAPGRFLVRGGRRAGRFLIEGADRVIVQRNPQGEDQMLADRFLKWVLPAVLRHRGLLVLHADTALTPAGAVGVAGRSGAGKSTALAALMARGCAMVSDDVTVLRAIDTGGIQALPGVPHLYLTAESARAVGRDIAGLPMLPWRQMKAAVPAHAQMALHPAPLRKLYILTTTAGDELRLTLLDGSEKFEALVGCLHGPGSDDGDQFATLAALAGQMSVIRAERPAARWSLGELADVLLTGGA